MRNGDTQLMTHWYVVASTPYLKCDVLNISHQSFDYSFCDIHPRYTAYTKFVTLCITQREASKNTAQQRQLRVCDSLAAAVITMSRATKERKHFNLT
jgi:hypothetical protein